MDRRYMSDKPYFQDQCDHGSECFIGSGSFYQKNRGEEPVECHIDVHVYNDSLGQSVCIRYGNDGHQYISAGSVSQFLRSAQGVSEIYREAWDIMRENGKVEYRKTGNL